MQTPKRGNSWGKRQEKDQGSMERQQDREGVKKKKGLKKLMERERMENKMRESQREEGRKIDVGVIKAK